MMQDNSYRALVVDDELPVRKLTIRALTQQGFSCDGAANGREARQLTIGNRYDVVVTDLRMPDGNGHVLAMELLAEEERPVVIVLTGMADPRLLKDLIGCGVDGVEFKPVRYDLFAAKVRAMVDRRRGIRLNYVEPLISWKLSR
jgi:DNA-binding response OmpR family regulator